MFTLHVYDLTFSCLEVEGMLTGDKGGKPEKHSG